MHPLNKVTLATMTGMTVAIVLRIILSALATEEWNAVKNVYLFSH